jgi:hypothetical protein
MGGAARAIGNEDLETKFDDAIKLLERPNTVVFNPSYVDARLHMCLANHAFISLSGCISRRSRQLLFLFSWVGCTAAGKHAKYRCPAFLYQKVMYDQSQIAEIRTSTRSALSASRPLVCNQKEKDSPPCGPLRAAQA